MRNRTRARELALQALYQHELCRRTAGSSSNAAELDDFLQDAATSAPALDYARWLVSGTISALDALDQRIAGAATNWKLNRIGTIDRCILRLALFEILESKEVPPKVAIDEAINLAKKYSTERSGAFVNGILDRIYGETRGAAQAVGGDDALPGPPDRTAGPGSEGSP